MLPHPGNFFLFLRTLFSMPGRARLKGIFTLVSLQLLALSVCNWAFMLLDRIFFPGINDVKPQKPVFIYGNARSGTTLLEHLLFTHSNELTYQKTYEMMLPSIIQRKLISGIGSIDSLLFGGVMRKFIASAEQRATTEIRKIHPTSLDAPEEDEGMFAPLFISPVFLLGASPTSSLDRALKRFDDFSPSRQRKVLNFYYACIQRHLYCNGKTRRYCSKHVSSLRKITEQGLVESGNMWNLFPDATLIYLVRDPLETIPSTMNLMRTTWRGVGHTDLEDWMLIYQSMFNALCTSYEWAADQHLNQWNGRDVKIVSYQTLKDNPLQTSLDIYNHLRLDISGIDMDRLRHACKESHTYAPASYSPEEFGLSDTIILERTATFRRVFSDYLGKMDTLERIA